MCTIAYSLLHPPSLIYQSLCCCSCCFCCCCCCFCCFQCTSCFIVLFLLILFQSFYNNKIAPVISQPGEINWFSKMSISNFVEHKWRLIKYSMLYQWSTHKRCKCRYVSMLWAYFHADFYHSMSLMISDQNAVKSSPYFTAPSQRGR